MQKGNPNAKRGGSWRGGGRDLFEWAAMATLDEIARLHTSLDPTGLGHLKRLVGAWGMLSDLCFADLLLFVPVAGGPGSKYIVLGQVRPTTSQTLHRDDLVGRIMDEADRALVARALRLGEIVEGEISITPKGERARICLLYTSPSPRDS